MANHPSAWKRHLQSEKRRAQNRSRRAELATQIKKARLEITQETAVINQGEIKSAVSLLARAASKGLLHRRTASRRISRLMKQTQDQ